MDKKDRVMAPPFSHENKAVDLSQKTDLNQKMVKNAKNVMNHRLAS
jgi:hypothetical protein